MAGLGVITALETYPCPNTAFEGNITTSFYVTASHSVALSPHCFFIFDEIYLPTCITLAAIHDVPVCGALLFHCLVYNAGEENDFKYTRYFKKTLVKARGKIHKTFRRRARFGIGNLHYSR